MTMTTTTNRSYSNSRKGTYEATLAQQTVDAIPDPIIWDRNHSFRQQNYRLLHHQKCTIGLFSCRLLEASNLTRNYWSALALGPVKHLQLSKAHGAVSSFCSFQLNVDNNNSNEALDRKLRPSIISPVIPQDNDPVWDNFCFEFPLQKGKVKDGQRIYLQINVEEESTKIDTLLPQGGTRLLGTGQIDLTELCLGETTTGQSLPGVRDVWVDIFHEREQMAGKVRVLVSYTPHGLEPQPDDTVALESFARRNPNNNSCRPVLDPLLPYTVLDKRGSYLLCEYKTTTTTTNMQTSCCVRLHRNAVFVIERKNLVDDLHNLALLPLDICISTPIGRTVQHTLSPVLKASSELLMPALLSVKLVWMATRTAGLGLFSGVHALSSTMWQEGSSSLTGVTPPRRRQRHTRNQGGGRAAQFVQL